MNTKTPSEQLCEIVSAIHNNCDERTIGNMFSNSDFLSRDIDGRERAIVSHGLYNVIKQAVALEKELAILKAVVGRYEAILKNAISNPNGS